MAEAIPMNAANVNQIPNATYGAGAARTKQCISRGSKFAIPCQFSSVSSVFINVDQIRRIVEDQWAFAWSHVHRTHRSGPNESFKMPDGQDSDNADRRSSDEAATIEEATVRVKADVRALQQLSSSGRAAQRKRDINQAKKGFRAVGEAVSKYFGKEGEEGGGHDKGRK
ncbi:hypothetical protein BDFG_03642 [Blastomyces dermatitidis ATCC 26199]|nr:hypothetical protein BDFG_03642 [Blastomyces dermatitidis ATCC 26199]